MDERVEEDKDKYKKYCGVRSHCRIIYIYIYKIIPCGFDAEIISYRIYSESGGNDIARNDFPRKETAAVSRDTYKINGDTRFYVIVRLSAFHRGFFFPDFIFYRSPFAGRAVRLGQVNLPNGITSRKK